MVFIVESYTATCEPHLKDIFLIPKEHVKRIWDIDPGIIGIFFSNS